MKRTAMITAAALIAACMYAARAEWVGGTGTPDTVTVRTTAPRADQTGGTVVAPNTATESTASLNWESDYDTALDKAKKNKKLVMVDVYTDWCGWCKRLDKTTYSDKTVQETLARSFVTVKINPEKSKKNAALAKQFGTRGYPHIVFLDDSGKKISDIIGYQSAALFQNSLNDVLKKAGK